MDELEVCPPGDSDLLRQQQLLRSTGLISAALEHLPTMSVVINHERRIVFANQAFAQAMKADAASLLGMRLGDATNCHHGDDVSGDCGNTAFCRVCGAARAQLAALSGLASGEECRIRSKRAGEDLNLRVWATPIQVGGETFAVLTLVDVSHERRREMLERTFFHDILNTAGGIQGLTMMLAGAPDGDRDELANRIRHLSSLLVEEIQAQRDLIAMERGEFAVRMASVTTGRLLSDVVDTYRSHELTASRALVVAPSDPVAFTSDATLLRRVLGNMTKNALEACPDGGAVTIGCETREERVVFSVHNPTTMPQDVQMQVFQRSFSTKGAGRGLGTYSMRLISERYLHGKAWFTSSDDEGTTFFAAYPLSAVPRNTARS